MLHRALELEVEEYLERHHAARDGDGHALVTRPRESPPAQGHDRHGNDDGQSPASARPSCR